MAAILFTEQLLSRWRAFIEGTAADKTFNRLSLRFHDVGVEEGFAKARVSTVVANFQLTSLTTAAASVGALLLPKPPSKSPEEEEVLTFVQWAVMGILVYVLAASCLSCVIRRWFASPNPMAVELVCVSIIIGGLALHTFALPWYAAYALGYDASHCCGLDDSTDSPLLLLIVSVVSASHMALPIRLHTMIVVQMGGALSYAIPTFLVGGPETRNSEVNMMFLLCSIGISSFGKRVLEIQERILFATVLKEKGLRFQSEFELARIAGRRPAKAITEVDIHSLHSEAMESHPESRPETTMSERVFTSSGAQVLAELVPIGLREQWLVSKEEVEVSRSHVLGEGGFGTVMRGDYQGVAVAVKVAKSTGVPSRSRAVSLLNELRILRRLRHPNIVAFYGACIDDTGGQLALVLELVKGETLGDFVDPNHKGRSSNHKHPSSGTRGEIQRRPSEAARAHVLAGVSFALRYLHSRAPQVVHGDLKDSNVFVEAASPWPNAKLLDFGLSRSLTRHALPLGGTPRWAAPEVHLGQTPRAASDVFSFSRLVFFVATGSYPWNLIPVDELKRAVARGQMPELSWPDRCGLLAEKCKAFVKECDSADPACRPSMKQVSVHAARWLEEMAKEAFKAQARPESTASEIAGSGSSPECGICDTGDSAVGTAPDPGPTVLSFPELAPTPAGTLRAMLSEIACSGNMQIYHHACCNFHGAMQSLASTIQDIRKGHCVHLNFSRTSVKQCAACGLLRRDADGQQECFFCAQPFSNHMASSVAPTPLSSVPQLDSYDVLQI